MRIKIHKRTLSEGSSIDDGEILYHKYHYTIYVITQDGKRLDSFLEYKNALIKKRKLEAAESSK